MNLRKFFGSLTGLLVTPQLWTANLGKPQRSAWELEQDSTLTLPCNPDDLGYVCVNGWLQRAGQDWQWCSGTVGCPTIRFKVPTAKDDVIWVVQVINPRLGEPLRLVVHDLCPPGQSASNHAARKGKVVQLNLYGRRTELPWCFKQS